jgi:hypothetical protein
MVPVSSIVLLSMAAEFLGAVIVALASSIVY